MILSALNPLFQPALRIIFSITTGGPTTTITTNQPHLYQTGLIVRINIPDHWGMPQLNKFAGPITVTSPFAFTVNVDSTTFDPPEVPPAPLAYHSYPNVVPIGESNDQLTQATRNVLG